MKNYLADLYEHDLLKLKDELENFRDEANIWKKAEGVANSVGTLVLHLIGSLNYAVGAKIGKTGYVRDRDREFSLTNVPRQKLIAGIDDTIKVIDSSFQKMDQAEALRPTHIKCYGHFNYHLGQINYLRRILEGGTPTGRISR
jgi:hypothetical protein